MNTIKEHLGDKFSIYLLLLTIGVLLLFYSFVYVPKKQNQLNDHAVRILENKARSIHDKYKGYEHCYYLICLPCLDHLPVFLPETQILLPIHLNLFST